MTIETSKIIIDENLTLDVNTGIIGSQNTETQTLKAQTFPTEDIMQEINKLEQAIEDLESSFDSNSISRLSKPGREGTYHTAGLLTNIVIGIIIGLIIIILLV